VSDRGQGQHELRPVETAAGPHGATERHGASFRNVTKSPSIRARQGDAEMNGNSLSPSLQDLANQAAMDPRFQRQLALNPYAGVSLDDPMW
jgi:hypothetical protein